MDQRSLFGTNARGMPVLSGAPLEYDEDRGWRPVYDWTVQRISFGMGVAASQLKDTLYVEHTPEDYVPFGDAGIRRAAHPVPPGVLVKDLAAWPGVKRAVAIAEEGLGVIADLWNDSKVEFRKVSFPSGKSHRLAGIAVTESGRVLTMAIVRAGTFGASDEPGLAEPPKAELCEVDLQTMAAKPLGSFLLGWGSRPLAALKGDRYAVLDSEGRVLIGKLPPLHLARMFPRLGKDHAERGRKAHPQRETQG